MPARNPRMLNGSAASVVRALAMRPARITRISAVVSNGTTGSTSAPPTPQVMASMVTVARTPLRTARSDSRRREATYIHAPRSSAVSSTAPPQPSLEQAGEVGADALVRRDGVLRTRFYQLRAGHGCYMLRYGGKTDQGVLAALAGVTDALICGLHGARP